MMKRDIFSFLTATVLALYATGEEWNPSLNAERAKELAPIVSGRVLELYEHGIRPEWGYEVPQRDTFVVIHPKEDRKSAPLYVVLHSAGHDVISCVKCLSRVGNHDIYHSPDDFYALYLDCRANKGDWWWGGMHVKDANLIKKNSGGDPMPVERRVIDTVKWVMKKYAIDPNRVYLCGNSMGGSGTLGIGVRNGDLFAAIKANVPAGIEHVSNRMYFPPLSVPEDLNLPDPPIVIDYSAPNDGWSSGHERFFNTMNERKYALYGYWGPFGHANDNAKIMQVNDLINSFDWLNVRLNEAYAVFSNASCNDSLPLPDNLTETAPGQINAFFRGKVVSDTKNKLQMSIFLTSATDCKTMFAIPEDATADVSIRRLQNLRVKPGQKFTWSYGAAKGTVTADAGGLITIPGLKITSQPETLAITIN